MKNDPCQIALSLEVIGGKWKGPILWWIKDEPKRFNELKRLIPEITQRTLTNQLRELVRDGLVIRTQFQEVPLRVEYSPTKLCLSLLPILDELAAWGRRNKSQIEKSRRDYES
jgi:DNA-binding HxlR family transcriptional regulator